MPTGTLSGSSASAFPLGETCVDLLPWLKVLASQLWGLCRSLFWMSEAKHAVQCQVNTGTSNRTHYNQRENLMVSEQGGPPVPGGYSLLTIAEAGEQPPNAQLVGGRGGT